MPRNLLLCALLGSLLLLAAPFPVVSAEDDGVDEKDVVVLTDKNFADTISGAKFALVEFYAPWCGHCKSLKPEYAKAATALKAYDATIVLGKLDATEEKEVAGKHEVQGYPTLKWFVNGKMAMDFGGGRTADEIVRWVKKKTGPATTEVATVEALEKAEKENAVFVLAFFDKFEGDAYAAFEAAAQANDAAAFLKTTSAEVAAKLSLTAAPGFALGRTTEAFGFEAIPATFEAASDKLAESLEAFIKAEKLPAFTEFTSESSSAIFGSGVNHQIIVTAPGAQFAKGSPLFDTLVASSSKLKGKIVMVIAKTESDNGKPIIEYFGLSKDVDTPQVVGFDSAGGKKFKFEGEVTTDALVTFGEAVAAGTAQKFFKSAAEPAEPLEGGVAIITGNTVESIVKDTSKDVLLEVYAPWCGHCKTLKPIYEKLAKRFAKVDSVVIAKMDGTENEHPDIEASGYPTLIFYPAGEGAAPIPYEGGRTLADMTKFLKKHATKPFELPKKKKGGDKKAAAADAEEAPAAAAAAGEEEEVKEEL